MPITRASEGFRRLGFTVDSNGDLVVFRADRDQVALIVSTLLAMGAIPARVSRLSRKIAG
jgi:hypothetical protein